MFVTPFFLQLFKSIVKKFLSLDDKSKFNWLLANSDDEVIIQLGLVLYMNVLKFMVNKYVYFQIGTLKVF